MRIFFFLFFNFSFFFLIFIELIEIARNAKNRETTAGSCVSTFDPPLVPPSPSSRCFSGMLSIRTRERNYQRLNLCSHNQKCRQQPRGGAARFSALRGQQRQNRRRFSKSNEHRQRENKERPSIVNETRFTRCIPGDIAIPLACPWHIRKPTSSLSVSERNRQRREKKERKGKAKEGGRGRERK